MIRVGGGVGRNSVAQGYIHVTIAQEGFVYIDVLLREVDAVGLKIQSAHSALDACGGNKVGGVDFQALDVELVNLNLTLEERQQLHVGHQMANVGHGVFHLRQGVVLLDDFHLIQA